LHYASLTLKERNIPYNKYYAAGYLMFQNVLPAYDWSSLYNKISVVAAVSRLNVAVPQGIDLTASSRHIKNNKLQIKILYRVGGTC
jgi:hypothetical protein